MPTGMSYALARKSGQPVKNVEQYWKEAKMAAAEKFGKKESEFDDQAWSYVTGIVQQRLGLKKEESAETRYQRTAQGLIERVLQGADADALVAGLNEVTAAGVAGGLGAAGAVALATGLTAAPLVALGTGVGLGAGLLWINDRIQRAKFKTRIAASKRQYGLDVSEIGDMFRRATEYRLGRGGAVMPSDYERAWSEVEAELSNAEQRKPVPSDSAGAPTALPPAVNAPVIAPVAPQA